MTVEEMQRYGPALVRLLDAQRLVADLERQLVAARLEQREALRHIEDVRTQTEAA